MSQTTSATVDRAVAEARNLPHLIDLMQRANPAIAAQLTGKALLLSKSPIGVILGYIISMLVAKFGLGWDDQTVAIVTGIVVLIVAYAMRAITKQPITGLVSAPDQPPSQVLKVLVMIIMPLSAIVLAGLVLSACSYQAVPPATQAKISSDLSSVPGRLFCQIETVAGPTIVSVIDSGAAGAGGAAAIGVVMATGMSKAFVNDACAAAAVSAGGKAGVPVSPPQEPVGQVAIPVAALSSSTKS